MAVKLSFTAAPEKLHALITGPPGVGKTTLLRSVCRKLQEEVGPSLHLHGFYTEEVREGGAGRGTRVGFDVVTFDGQRGPLARVQRSQGASRDGTHFVGKYCVKLESFESLALPTLHRPTTTNTISDASVTVRDLYVVDEVGKMELFSRNFVDGVKKLFDAPRDDGVIVVATIPVARQKSHWLVEELRKRKDCLLFEVTEKNREGLVGEISDYLKERVAGRTT